MTISTDLSRVAALHSSGAPTEPERAPAGYVARRAPGRTAGGRRAHMNAAAVAGMVLGIVCVPLAFSYVFPVSLVAIVVSHVGLRQCERRGQRGWAFAVAGLAMGYGSLALTLLTVVGISTAG